MKLPVKKLLVLLFEYFLILHLPSIADAQIKEVGLPFINNYSRNTYKAGTQNWAITQGPGGIMYFANNDGVLEYDGNNWEIHPLPNASVVRSVAYVGNRIYAGGFDEFGYYSHNVKGEFYYVSVSDMLPEKQRSVGDIWRIYSTPSGIVFQSFLKIIILDNDKVSTIDPPSAFGFSYFVNDTLIVVDQETGLYNLNGNDLDLVYPDLKFFKENEITFILPNGNNSLLIGTANNGIFRLSENELVSWDVSANETFRKQQIYTGIALPEDQFAIGTIQDGLFVIDADGSIVLHFNRSKGMQNNTILSLFLDRHSNLWLGLDNGIDALEISSPYSLLNYYHNIESSYTSIVYDDILYIGTNQGLFAKKFSELKSQSLVDDKFKLVDGTKGQVWSLKIINNILICGHNSGTYRIDAFTATKISEIQGGWDYVQVPWDKSKLIGGVFNGLVLYKTNQKNAPVIIEDGAISGFHESCKELHFDNSKNLWVTHGYKGIYKLTLTEGLDSVSHIELYDTSNGLPELPYSMTEIGGDFYIVTKDGIYTYNTDKEIFILNHDMTALFEEVTDISKIYEDYKGDLWCFSFDGICVLRHQEDGTYSKISAPFNRVQNQLISSSFKNVYVFDSRNAFIGSPEGIIHYNSEKTKDFDIPYQTYIGAVTINNRENDSLLFCKIYDIQDEDTKRMELELAFRFNSISFQFMTPYFEGPHQISYSYRLKGNSEKWSAWSSLTLKEYTNLKEGDYTFEVKARNIYNRVSAPASFDFSVKPPFYRTMLAYVLYGLFLLAITFTIILYFRRRIKEIKEHEIQKRKRELLAKEQKFIEEAHLASEQIERLENEKLLTEMRHKDMELANSTMHIIQKNKFLNKVKNDAHNLIANLTLEENKQELRQIVKRIDKDITSDKQWKVFDKHFEAVHRDFTNRLKEKHPDLTPNDLRLCSYLRMNISTKEIAPLMNISVRGVEISRYRLRKKLDLDRDLNLTEYILSI